MARILVIEDDKDIRDLLKDILEGEGYHVIMAADGNEGIKLCREETVDLVITDILMPGKDGIETIFELQRHCPEVRIVAISGGGRVSPANYLQSAELLGAISTLTKPFGRRELLTEVTKALEASRGQAEVQ